MKPKISPEEYRNILNSIDLELITLTESKAKFQKEFIDNNIEISIKSKPIFSREENILNIKYRNVFKGKSADMEKAGIEIMAVYNIEYSVKQNVNIPDTFFDPFNKFVVEMMIWTYFREFIQNTISRMNLPPLTLPFKRI